MTTRRLTILILLGIATIQVATSAATIALLGRMTPAVERILEENVASVEAVETMLIALARGGQEAKPTFVAALEAARDNVTEPDEPEVLLAIERATDRAFEGDLEARSRITEALRELGTINRHAMARADLEARRLGTAGAWAGVLLAAIGIGATIAAARALGRTVLDPLDEVATVIRAQREGDRRRRCKPLRTTRELGAIMHALDDLLDVRDENFEPEAIRAEHVVLVHLLDEREGAWIACDELGSVLAANKEALERLSGDDGAAIRVRVRKAIRGETVDGLTPEALGDNHAFLFELGGATPPAAPSAPEA